MGANTLGKKLEFMILLLSFAQSDRLSKNNGQTRRMQNLIDLVSSRADLSLHWAHILFFFNLQGPL